MNLNLEQENRIYKQLFKLKSPERDGSLLTLHHTKNGSKIRFIFGAFDKTGCVLAVADKECNIFVIDFSVEKFWSLPKQLESCTILKFARDKEILIGGHNGLVTLINCETGAVNGELKGHEYPVSQITFNNDLCFTCSVSEAIIWDLNSCNKLHQLHLTHSCTIKFAMFITGTANIVICFNDDLLQIWNSETFEMKTQITPMIWYNHEVKNISFTLDGKIMVVGCRSPHLAVFLLSNYKLLKFITLPEQIQTLKHVCFIPQLHDGGANRILAILSSRGSLFFYDFEQNIIISELVTECAIKKIDFSLKGSYFSCILTSGDVKIYDIIPYIVVPVKLEAIRVPIPHKKNKMKKMGTIKAQVTKMLEVEKLRLILKECGEFPESYRMKIWEHLLQLPNSKHQFNSIINHRMIVSFENLHRKYPLKDKRCLKNLKQLLDNVVTWCPFFFHVDYLPQLVFPFVKVFSNKPVVCFEAVCTIIVNWCQFWFEYFPLPPINILSMIENLLMEHDADLLDFFTRKKITSKFYAWPILRSLFSEVLTASQWRVFWDHVLINEPSFLLCAVIAYNILQRSTLLALTNRKRLLCFYSTHHPIDVKKLLRKTYRILVGSSDNVHPRQYLKCFKNLTPGEYPDFCDYPKAILELKNDFKKEMNNLKQDEIDLFKKRLIDLNKFEDFQLDEEENKRIIEMENSIQQQLCDQQNRIESYYERVMKLRQKFQEHDEILTSLRGKIAKQQERHGRARNLKRIYDDVSLEKKQKNYQLTKVENELLYYYSELLRNRSKIELLLANEETPETIFDKHQESLRSQIELASSSGQPTEYIRNLNLTTSMEALDCLINKVETELEREKNGMFDIDANKRILKLKMETKELASTVTNLLQILGDLKNVEVCG